MTTSSAGGDVDAALFERVQRGESDAWASLVRRFSPLVLAVARRCGCTNEEAEDVMQSTWQRLFDHAPLIGAPRSLASWITTTARREAWRTTRRRREGSALEQAIGLERAAGVTDAPDHELVRLEEIQRVRDGVEALGGRCTALLQALFLAPTAPSYEAVSRATGVPVGSIGPTRARCLARLVDWLGDDGAGARAGDSGP